MGIKVLFLCGALAVSTASTFAATLWGPETFEYADQAALEAARTIEGAAKPLLSTDQNRTPSGSKSLNLGVGDVTNRMLGAFTATQGTDAEPLVCEFYLYDPNASAAGSAGMTFGAYSGGAFGAGTLENFFSVGRYTLGPGTPADYNRRIVYGASAGWLTLGVARTAGWHKFEIIVKSTTADIEVDDVLAAGGTNLGFTVPTTGFNCFRLSAFADNNLPSEASYIDDVIIYKGTPSSSVQDWQLY